MTIYRPNVVNWSYDHHPLSLVKSTLADEFYRVDEILTVQQSGDGPDGL